MAAAVLLLSPRLAVAPLRPHPRLGLTPTAVCAMENWKLSGLMDNGTKAGLLGVWMVLFTVFAARKFQQPIKDDIGDKSVFMFNALPEEEKKALIQKLEMQTETDG
uniref:Uncharacterized protein n=1 Tax=Oryza glumipatula TaxID=40148 RepID=A0A0D9ZFV2_9ORYZ